MAFSQISPHTSILGHAYTAQPTRLVVAQTSCREENIRKELAHVIVSSIDVDSAAKVPSLPFVMQENLAAPQPHMPYVNIFHTLLCIFSQSE